MGTGLFRPCLDLERERLGEVAEPRRNHVRSPQGGGRLVDLNDVGRLHPIDGVFARDRDQHVSPFLNGLYHLESADFDEQLLPRLGRRRRAQTDGDGAARRLMQPHLDPLRPLRIRLLGFLDRRHLILAGRGGR